MQVADCEALRREIKAIADRLYALFGHRVWPVEEREVATNSELAYRHLEDASMRLGKVIQALNGGVSVYDKTQVPESAPAG
jgi:hypothetical protein